MATLLTQLRINQDDLETGKYLGTGAFGAVFMGLWKSKDCKVAIKMVHVDNKEMMDELCLELNDMASLNHKHIRQLHGVSIISDGEVWMVLEYVDGPNLHDFLTTNGPASWIMQVSFALQSAQALNYLHSHTPPILHKDVRSLNLLVDTSTATVKLIDFGISKATEVVNAQTSVIGSQRWAAPEVVKVGKQKETKWSEKADIYSLGMLFFEIISCEFPFRYDSDFGSITKKIRHGVRPVIPSHCPSKFAEIMAKCWNPDPESRPTSQELVDSLTELENESLRSLISCRNATPTLDPRDEKQKQCIVQ